MIALWLGCVTLYHTGAGPGVLRIQQVGLEQEVRFDETRLGRHRAVAPASMVATSTGVVAYASRSRQGWWVHCPTQDLGPYVSVAEVQLSPTGDRCGFLAARREGWAVVVDGRVEATLPSVRAETFAVGPSGWGLVEQLGSALYWRTSEARWGPYDRIEDTSIVQDAASVWRGGRRFALVHGVEYGPFDTFQWLPGGRYWADGSLGPSALPDLDDSAVVDMALDPSGAHWAAVGPSGDGVGQILRVDGMPRARGEGLMEPKVASDGAWAVVELSRRGRFVHTDRGSMGPFRVVLPGSLSRTDRGWSVVVRDVEGWAARTLHRRTPVAVDRLREAQARLPRASRPDPWALVTP